jgi:hypothetical protein
MFRTHRINRPGRVRDERGTALAELALVMPILLVLLLGMVDLGKAFNEWLDENHLANLGARLAAVNYCPDLTTDGSGNPLCDWSSTGCTDANPNVCLARYIVNYTDLDELKNGRTGSETYAPNQQAAQVCIIYPNSTTTQHGDPVTVRVKVKYQWLKYLTNRVGFAAKTIQGTATMRLESTPYVAAPLDSESCYPDAPAGT